VRCVQLRALLLSLPQRKWVFTNCSEAHCRVALDLLGLQVRAGACACACACLLVGGRQRLGIP